MDVQDSIETLDQCVRAGDWSGLASELGFAPLDVSYEIPRSAWPVWGIPDGLDAAPRLIANPGDMGLRIIACPSSDSALARKVMRAVSARNPSEVTIWFWFDDHELRVASHLDSSRKMVVARDGTDAAGLNQLAALRIDQMTAAHANTGSLREHVEEVLDRKRLTRAFFKDFKRALQSLVDGMIDGPSDERSRHDIALITLLRLVFLYFLQRRAALDDDRRFLARKFRRPHEGSFYRSTLRPLFFEALNTPQSNRGPRARALGAVPFLNGGLFDITPDEAACGDLDWPDSVWTEVIDGLFERYQFLAIESDGDEVRAIDPEMLGKVFEGLMYADQRQKSGSFYTPRDVVERMVREAFCSHLSMISSAKIDAICRGESLSLEVDERQKLRRALDNLRVLDPAVGTGAFLLEALHVLTRLWEAVEGGTLDHVRTRKVIHDHLFGVDLLKTATRLCELRFWIALLARTPEDAIVEMPPLPNLSHRIAQGNSLVSIAETGTFRDDIGGTWQLTNNERRLAHEIEALQTKFCVAHGDEKVELRNEMEAAEIALAEARLRSRIERLDARIGPFEKLLKSKDIFGEEQTLSRSQRERYEALKRERDEVVEAIRMVVSDQGSNAGFGYDTRFAEAMAAGGFDLIITNPPWVRSELIDRVTLHVLKSRYRSFETGIWPEAAQRGVRAPYGSKVDLANLFIERSLELLRPGGRFVGLIPSKLFGSLQGTSTRAVVAEHCVEAVEDFSDASRELFDATTYPAILRVRKAAAANDNKAVVAVWRGDERSVFERQSHRFGTAPWILTEPHVDSIFERMRQSSGGEFLHPSRGIFTGCNALFIDDESNWLDRLGEESRPYLRRIATGRDPGASSDRRILWLYEDGEPLDDVPESIAAYFENQRDRLEARSDHRFDRPLWQIFRVNARHRARVVWRDIAPELEATVLDGEAIALNTVYQIGCDTPEMARKLAAFLESEPVRAWLYAHAEPARGGWRRHFAWTMRMVPLPVAFWNWLEDLELESRFDEAVARAFRLDRADVQILRGWRAGSRALTKREAA